MSLPLLAAWQGRLEGSATNGGLGETSWRQGPTGDPRLAAPRLRPPREDGLSKLFAGWLGGRSYEDALGGFTRTVRQGGKTPGERKSRPGKQVSIFLRAHKRVGDKHLQAIFG